MKIGDVSFCAVCGEVQSKKNTSRTCSKCKTYNSVMYVDVVARNTGFEAAIRSYAEYVDDRNGNHDWHVQNGWFFEKLRRKWAA